MLAELTLLSKEWIALGFVGLVLMFILEKELPWKTPIYSLVFFSILATLTGPAMLAIVFLSAMVEKIPNINSKITLADVYTKLKEKYENRKNL